MSFSVTILYLIMVANMGPNKASHPVSRAKFGIQISNVSSSYVYMVAIDLSMFYRCLPFRTPFCSKIYHALFKLSIVLSAPPITTSVTPPLLNRDYRDLSRYPYRCNRPTASCFYFHLCAYRGCKSLKSIPLITPAAATLLLSAVTSEMS